MEGCLPTAGRWNRSTAPAPPRRRWRAGDLVPPEDRERAFGLLYWAINLGFAVGMVVAGALASVSYRLLFVGDATTTLAFAAIIAARFPETRPPVAAAPALREAVRGLVETFTDRRLVRFLAIVLATATVFLQLQAGFPVDAARHGVGPATFGRLVALNCVAIGVLQPFAIRLVAGRDRGRVIALAALLVGCGYGLYALGGSVPLYAAGVLVWTVGEILGNPTAGAVVADLAPAHLRGRYQGALGLTWSLAMFAAPALGSLVLDRLGARALWLGCLVVGAAAAAAHLAFTVPALRGREARAATGARPSPSA